MNLIQAIDLLKKNKKVSIIGKDSYFYLSRIDNENKILYVKFNQKECSKFKYAKVYIWHDGFPENGYEEYFEGEK